MATPAFLGNGLLRPFQRDQKNDFANGAGARLIQATAGQVLGTRCSGPKVRGEIPWRTEFGSLLYLLRHRPINTTNRELARHWAQDALRRWEPRIVVTRADLEKKLIGELRRRTLLVRVFFDVIDRNVSGNRVILSGLQAEALIE